jgi:oligosaccharyltransferase complex subunit alpha (ribophorin I)
MKLFPSAAALLVLAASCIADQSSTLSSHQILPATFKPPQVFKNVNLVRNVNLDKNYVKESVNVVIENVSKEPQTEYFIPFDAHTIGKVGSVDVRDKNGGDKPGMKAEIVEYDPSRFVT